jgi:hypothetical protein
MIYNPVTSWFVMDRLLNVVNGSSSGNSHRSLLKRLGLSATLGVDWEQPAEQRATVVSSEDEPPYWLGVMTLPSLFGRRCSARTFGHAGGNTSALLVDPLFDLVVAVYWTGRLDDVKTFARRYALVRALYGELGLPQLPPAPRGKSYASRSAR